MAKRLIEIDAQTWQDFRSEVIKENKKTKEVVAELLQKYVEERRKA